MASIISALSLFILVLIHSCFTLPIIDEHSWTATLSSLNDDLTTEIVSNLSLVFNDETTILPVIQPKSSVDDHLVFSILNSTDDLLVENATRTSRTFDESFTSEPLTSTIPESFDDKRVHDELLFTTIESVTQVLEHALRSVEDNSQNEVERISERSDSDNSTSPVFTLTTQSTEVESKNLVQSFTDESTTTDMKVESTTSFMPSFTSTSSAVAPELSTTESSTSTSTSTLSSTTLSLSVSTGKYIGLLTDDDQHDEEQQQEKIIETESTLKPQTKVTSVKKYTIHPKFSSTRKSGIQSEDKSNEDLEQSQSKWSTTRKFQTQSEDKSNEDLDQSQTKFSTTTKRSKVQLWNKSNEDSKESNIPIAVFDQEALKKVSNVPNDFMILEENDETVISNLPVKSSTVPVEVHINQKTLNQDQKSSQSEEKESDN